MNYHTLVSSGFQTFDEKGIRVATPSAVTAALNKV